MYLVLLVQEEAAYCDPGLISGVLYKQTQKYMSLHTSDPRVGVHPLQRSLYPFSGTLQ